MKMSALIKQLRLNVFVFCGSKLFSIVGRKKNLNFKNFLHMTMKDFSYSYTYIKLYLEN